jgi:hypothetical protein
VENINNDVPQHQPYRNEKVFNSGKTALELNFSETNGSVNLILAGPLVSKPEVLTGLVKRPFQQS